MNSSEFSKALHLVHGDSGGGSLLMLPLSRDRILVNEDSISCGPAPAADDLDTWRSIREGFWREVSSDAVDCSFDPKIGVLLNADRLREEAQVIVWVGCGLNEQLFLAWVVFLFDRLGVDPSKLSVIQFEESHPGQPAVKVGELNLEFIRKHRPEPRRLKAEEVGELRRAWSVYTSSDPVALSSYVAGPSPMPLLHRAVSRLVYRYPDARSGLSVWDERLLHNTAGRERKVALVIGKTMGGSSDDLDTVGDRYLFYRLIDLGRTDLASPLISITGRTKAMRLCEAKLTAFGSKVRAREANHVEVNGIDDWVGGVHLSGERPVAFLEGNSLVLNR